MSSIEKRKKVYDDFPKKNCKINLSNIVLFYEIDKNDYEELIESVRNFLVKSLSVFYKKGFIWSDNFLIENIDLIQDISIKTPNGILKPKKETIVEYTDIIKSINKIINNLGINHQIEKVALPNIRFKNISEPTETKERPYYTGKLHSDAWVGHKGDSIFLIGVLGDIDNNTVEFFEPFDTQENYLTKADSFDEGNKRYGSIKYLGKLTSNKLAIMDHACVHRTSISSEAGPRISIDIAALIKSQFSHAYDSGFDESAYSYHDFEIINEIGKSRHFSTEDTFFNNLYEGLKII
jgi:hypothetical protein